MADIAKKDSRREPLFTNSSPYGNLSVLSFSVETTSGVVNDGDKTTAAVSGDVVIAGVIPAGAKLIDSVAIISAAFTALTTVDIGFRYVDGEDDTDVPEDSDYFADGADGATAARLRNATANATVVLPKDAYLIVTLLDVTQAATSKLEFELLAELKGGE